MRSSSQKEKVVEIGARSRAPARARSAMELLIKLTKKVKILDGQLPDESWEERKAPSISVSGNACSEGPTQMFSLGLSAPILTGPVLEKEKRGHLIGYQQRKALENFSFFIKGFYLLPQRKKEGTCANWKSKRGRLEESTDTRKFTTFRNTEAAKEKGIPVERT